jgi:hypothetical protein
MASIWVPINVRAMREMGRSFRANVFASFPSPSAKTYVRAQA